MTPLSFGAAGATTAVDVNGVAGRLMTGGAVGDAGFVVVGWGVTGGKSKFRLLLRLICMEIPPSG
jgi:hypothetical protein